MQTTKIIEKQIFGRKTPSKQPPNKKNSNIKNSRKKTKKKKITPAMARKSKRREREREPDRNLEEPLVGRGSDDIESGGGGGGEDDLPPISSAGYLTSLKVVMLTNMVDMLGFGLLLPILPYYYVTLKGYDEQHQGLWYGLITCSFSLGQFIGSFGFGAISDKYGT
jgi:hypothetical protein